MRKARVLHLIGSFVIGGAQRSVSTLLRTPRLESRVDHMMNQPPQDLTWADVVVAHAWRETRERPDINLPSWIGPERNYRLILFNHDWEGRCDVKVDILIVYSKFAATNWRGPEEAIVLPGGIGLERFAHVAARRNWETVSTVGRLSTLNPGKIHVDTLAYWPHIHATKFLVGGDGDRLHSLREATSDSRMCFFGAIPPSMTHEFFAGVDIFLYDTEWHIESFGYVVLEAMAAGCVVVAARKGAIDELIVDGVNGFLFDDQSDAIAICNSLIAGSSRARPIAEAAVLAARAYPSSLMQERFTACVTRLVPAT